MVGTFYYDKPFSDRPRYDTPPHTPPSPQPIARTSRGKGEGCVLTGR